MPVSTNPYISLQTYYNYVDTWVIAVGRKYGSSNASLANMCAAQDSIKAFMKLQGGCHLTRPLESEFFKAKLIGLSMQKLPVDERPGLAITENLWMPVKSYYAFQSMGKAVLCASKVANNAGVLPADHRAFLASFSRNISQLLPFPFNALCDGGPAPNSFDYGNLSTSAGEILAYNQLRNPRYAGTDVAIGKSLSTTRDRNLQEILDKARTKSVSEGRSRRNLSKEETLKFAANLHSTSIGDLLYRMRRRSNYRDSEMYLAAFDRTEDALVLYKNLTFLTTSATDLMSRILAKKLGKEAMAGLESRFLRISGGL